ncbi:hypothetical protein JVU11DRAFT_7672 [Chiua virens]|nr:hypothetical protein JVU11DRAFT_7672 [Chiua virens]
MYDDDNDNDNPSQAWRDSVFTDWHTAVQTAHARLLSSSTNTRLAFLRDDFAWLINQGMSRTCFTCILDVFKLLTQTYPRYIDTPSRDAVEKIGMRLVLVDQSAPKLGILDHVLGWLANEVAHMSKPSPSSYAAADIFVLLSWSCGLYTTCLSASPDFVSSNSWRVLTGTFASLLDLQLNPSTRSKHTLQKSALVRTRRALRSAPDHLHSFMSTLITHAKSTQTPLIYVPLLGTAVDVTIRLKNVKD